jgi:molybdate/tungstate transport system substrate-binding protein
MKKAAILCLLLGLASGLVSASCSAPDTQIRLVVFEADSLMVPFAQIEKEFEQANPDIRVEMQAHGSIQVIRHVTELGMNVDVVAVADNSLIPMLMYQTKMSDGRPYASWNIMPVTNELVLAYTARSKYHDELNSGNWYDIVSRPDVRFGLADPRMDAVGYRNLMALKLAESHYRVDNIMRDCIGRHFSIPITDSDANGTTTILVPEVLEPTGTHMVLRGAHMQLLALLESGDVDYTIDYKSAVIQDRLEYIELPPEVNLGVRDLAKEYQRVVVKLDYKRFKTVDPVFQGLPIVYGVTIANNSKNKEAAARFINFVLSPEGQRIFQSCNQPELVPPECDNIQALPQSLRQFFH